MAELNKIDCGVNVSNVGYGDCVLDFKKIIGGFEVPRDMVITPADLADLQTFLKNGINAPSKRDRIYPLPMFEAVTDNTEDPVFQTLGYGTQQPVRDGFYNWVFQWIKGAFCVSKKWRTHNNSYGKFLFFDDQNVLMGTTATKEDGTVGIGGYDMNTFFTFPWKLNDGANVTSYRMMFVFEPKQANEFVAYTKANFNLSNLKGLENAVLSVVGGPTTGVVQINVATGCSGENLYDEFGADLAVPSLWKMYNTATGAEISITSVAQNTGLKAYTVTPDVTDTDYPSASTADVTLGLADITALVAADIVGFEGVSVTYKRGS